MQVIYDKSVLDKIHEEVAKAHTDGRTIGKIVLTRDEADQLRRHIQAQILPNSKVALGVHGASVGGVLIEVEHGAPLPAGCSFRERTLCRDLLGRYSKCKQLKGEV